MPSALPGSASTSSRVSRISPSSRDLYIYMYVCMYIYNYGITEFARPTYMYMYVCMYIYIYGIAKFARPCM
jgi:hypothetical protein